ncbi:Uncharacterized protein APZ42_012351 [Daphnia magna]|uniref:Uncharacterized protein n=1 Tax=Daphnia magna TaxID=35525 RepID=A0A162RX73_9CRUS|nr:Uncharacterized protein APZ42_012351 [Daphnia magna]
MTMSQCSCCTKQSPDVDFFFQTIPQLNKHRRMLADFRNRSSNECTRGGGKNVSTVAVERNHWPASNTLAVGCCDRNVPVGG